MRPKTSRAKSWPSRLRWKSAMMEGCASSWRNGCSAHARRNSARAASCRALSLLFQRARKMPLQNGARYRIGLLQVDAPIFQLIERDPRIGHRAAHIGSRRDDAEIAVEILDLCFAVARGAELVQQG